MYAGTYFDYERGTLVPNTLKVLKERHDEFKTSCQSKEDSNWNNSKKWWSRSLAKSKADSLLNHLDHILLQMEVNEPYYARYVAMKACVLYEAGIFLSKNPNTALLLFRKAHELLWPLLPKCEVYWLYFVTVNKYCEIMKDRDSDQTIIQVLEDSIKVYDSREVPKVLYTCRDLFSLYFKIQPIKETRQILEQTVTVNYQLLINLYITNYEVMKYIRCEHFLLRRELQLNTITPNEWIERALVIAKILITEHDFRNARHHLAVATNQYKKALAKFTDRRDEEKARILKNHTEESLACAWIKYGLSLLKESKESKLIRYSHGDAPSFSHMSEYKDIHETSNMMKPSPAKMEILVERKISEHSFQLLHEITEKDTPHTRKIDDSHIEGDSKIIIDHKDDSSSIIDTALLLYPQDTYADKLSDALNKKYYVDLRFPAQSVNDIEKKISRSIIDTPKEAAELFLFLLPWIDVIKKIIHLSSKPLKYTSFILELNEFFKILAFFQPDPKQQYELHKERQTELEMLAWLLKKEDDPTHLTTELEVTKELSIAHYQLTQMNLKRVRELEEEKAAIKDEDNSDIIKEMLYPVTSINL